MAAAFSESSESELRLGLMTSSTVTCLDVEQPHLQGVAPADTDQSPAQMQDMSPRDNELLEIQDMVPHVEGHPSQQHPSGLSGEQSWLLTCFNHQMMH